MAEVFSMLLSTVSVSGDVFEIVSAGTGWARLGVCFPNPGWLRLGRCSQTRIDARQNVVKAKKTAAVRLVTFMLNNSFWPGDGFAAGGFGFEGVIVVCFGLGAFVGAGTKIIVSNLQNGHSTVRVSPI